jgi:hypothetical protein
MPCGELKRSSKSIFCSDEVQSGEQSKRADVSGPLARVRIPPDELVSKGDCFMKRLTCCSA